MMKGLFNYEEAYRIYTQEILKDFVKDNIQYAEIRPNFMSTNQLWKNDGSCLIDNYGIMDIIVQETEKFMKEHPTEFGGLKVIYCTPRSFDNEKVKFALEQCIDFKKRWPKWIAGSSPQSFVNGPTKQLESRLTLDRRLRSGRRGGHGKAAQDFCP